MHAPVYFPDVIGLPLGRLGRLPAFGPRCNFSWERFSRLQTFRYVQATKFVRLPGCSHRYGYAVGGRGFYIRAERASLPPHAPDMLAVRIQAIDGARTCTLLDSQHCRLLPSQIVPTAASYLARRPRLLRPSRTCVVTFARIGHAIRPTTGNWRNENFHLARFAALSAATE